MATKVHIKNFQSIEEADLEIEGFTVITGKNNSGKSAVQRAIRGVFQNTRGHTFVRHGATHCEVALSFSDGHTVKWEKGKKTNKYTLDGKVFDKVGSGVPDEILDLGLAPLEAGNKQIWAQFAPQFTGQVFLLDETGSVLAEAISDVDRVTQLNKSLKASEKDKRAANNTLKVRKEDQKTFETQLSFYDGLDDVGDLLSQIEIKEQNLSKLESGISILSGLQTQYEDLSSIIQGLEGIHNISVPDDQIISELSDQISELVSIEEEFLSVSDTVSFLDGFSHISAPSTEELERVSENLSDLETLSQSYDQFVTACETMLSMQGVLQNSLAPLDDLHFDLLRRYNDGLDLLEGLMGDWDRSCELIESLEGTIQEKKREQVRLDNYLQEHLKHEGGCPLCGSSL